MSLGISDILTVIFTFFLPSSVFLTLPSHFPDSFSLLALRKAKRRIKRTRGRVWEGSLGDSRHVGWAVTEQGWGEFP